MKIYMAPMESITRPSFRRIHSEIYGRLDRYFTPFITPSPERALRSRELEDVLPENNKGLDVVPQILTNRADLFLTLAGELKKLGYEEVNLNLGCPSGTVTAKGKGAGALKDLTALQLFLNEIFEKSPVKISVKSRIGVEDVSEFQQILTIYNTLPMTELILHPRLLKEQYKGHAHRDIFALAAEQAGMPLVYNGDIFTVEDYRQIVEQFPDIKGVMLGRGLIADPGLAAEIRSNTADVSAQNRDKEYKPAAEIRKADPIPQMQDKNPGREEFRRFCNAYYQDRKAAINGDRNLMFHMKELWYYWEACFPGEEKAMKKLKKITRAAEYEAWCRALFESGNWDPSRGFQPKE